MSEGDAPQEGSAGDGGLPGSTVAAPPGGEAAVRWERQASALETRYRDLLESAPDAMVIVNLEGRILMVNAETERLFGYSRQELLGQSVDLLVPQRYRGKHGDHRAGFFGEPRGRAMGAGMELHGLRKDGTEFPVEISLAPLQTEEGALVSSAIRDITDRKRIEAKLRESEERYRTVVETATDAIVTVDEGGTVLFANSTSEKVFGHAVADIVGQPLTMLIPEAGRQQDGAFGRAAGPGQKRIPTRRAMEVHGLHQSGAEIPLEISLSDTESSGRRVFTAILRDVTERKVSESIRSALYRITETTSGGGGLFKFYQAIHRTVSNLMDATNFCIVLKDLRSGRVTFPYLVDERDPTPRSARSAGLTEFVLTTGEPLLATRETFERLALQNKAEQRGGTAPAKWLGVPLKEAGRTFGVLVVQSYSENVRLGEPEKEILSFVARHVAATLEKKRAEEEVAEWKQRFEVAVAASGQVLYDWDSRADVVTYGGCVEALLGYTTEELGSSLGNWLQLIHPTDAETFGVERERCLFTREPFRMEYRVRRKDGRTIFVRDEGYFVGPRSAANRMVGFVADVTERKSLEEQLRHSRKMEAIGRLAGGVAHDFNNVLTAILGYSDLLLRQIEDPELRQGVEEIKRAGERAASLTSQLLAFSRKQLLAPRVLDLNRLVANMQKMLQRVIGEDVELVTSLDPMAGNVKADPGQLEHVLMNLAVNARDAMPGGGRLTIETGGIVLDEAGAREVGLKPGPHVMLGVSDTGQGMDEETRAHLFEPFFTTKEQGKGTGLGLATSYGIVQQSGGSIRVESAPEKGTSLRIYLPRVTQSVDAAVAPTPTGRLTGTETVLLVEDEQAVAALVKRALQESGYRVLEAHDGSEALEQAFSHSGPIDLLLTDVVMPGMSGRELADRLTADQPSLKVLYVSGYTDSAVVSRGVRGKAFLQKPFSFETLLSRVRETLDGN